MRSIGGVFGYAIQCGQKRLDLLLESPCDAVQPLAEPGEPVSLELEAVDVAEHVPKREVFVQFRGELINAAQFGSRRIAIAISAILSSRLIQRHAGRAQLPATN